VKSQIRKERTWDLNNLLLHTFQGGRNSVSSLFDVGRS